MDTLMLYSLDPGGRKWPVGDASSITFTTKENGFDTLNFTLPREFQTAWDDIGLDFQLLLYNGRGDVAWWGRLENYVQSLQNGAPSVKVVGSGYWYSAFDLTVSGTVTGTTPEACIKSLMSTTYLLQISTTQTGIYTTGVTGYSYTTGNGGTDDVRVGDVILGICQYGDSSNNRVIPYVLDSLGADGKPLLSTKAVSTSSPSVRYIVYRDNVASMGISSSLSLVRNRVIVRYKDSTTGALSRVTVNNTTSQGNLGVDFTGGGTTTNYIRTELLDISNLNNGASSTNATLAANNRLNEVSRVRRVASGAITINQDYVVFDTVEGQEIPNWKVRAGYFIQIPDLYPRANPTGSGTNAGDAALNQTFYITQTNYNNSTGALQITPEAPTDLASVVSK